MFRKPAFWLVVLVVAALAFNFFHPFDIQAPHISLASEEIARIGPLSISNTLLASWLTMIVLIVLSILATRHMRLVPRGLQNVIEAVLEPIYANTEIAAGEWASLAFPTIATLFLFIVASNWLGLLPGFLSIVVRHVGEDGQLEQVPLLRSAATDLNLTLALGIASVLMSQVYGLRVVGFPRYLLRFVKIHRFVAFFRGLFGRGPRVGVGNLFLGLIDLFVGALELFDEFAKVLSFSFRLFGNIFAGEVLLGVMIFLVPFAATLPFLGLEVFVGVIQAFVFAVLSAAFVAQATAGEAEGETVQEEAEGEVRLPAGTAALARQSHS